MKLKTIKASNAKGYLILGFDTDKGYTRYTVSEKEYSHIGSPLIGDELSSDMCELLLNFAEYNRAKKKALGILAFGDNSRYALVGKLVRSGIKMSLAKNIAEEMLELGYIDEERQLCRLIEREINSNKFGPGKFIPKLRARGYSDSMIRSVLDELSDKGTVSLSKTKKELCAGIESDEEKRKILYKHGF